MAQLTLELYMAGYKSCICYKFILYCSFTTHLLLQFHAVIAWKETFDLQMGLLIMKDGLNCACMASGVEYVQTTPITIPAHSTAVMQQLPADNLAIMV